ncbi:MAG TPA: helicase-associated domain-containing protein [Acidobacteriota bacterium]|nr:helicase-associated domain-containing protein [Acidobacteriota bacterium]
MKLYAFPWERFFARLPHWNRLSLEARKTYLEASGDPSDLARAHFQGSLDELLEAGFLSSRPDRQSLRIPPQQTRYRKLMQTLCRQDLLGTPSSSSFGQYLDRHFPARHQATLIDTHPVRGNQAREALFEQVSGEEWIESFLELKEAEDFERRHLNSDERPFLITPKNLREMQRLIRLLISAGEPQEMAQLGGHFETLHLHMLIPAGLRYLLLYPGMDERTLSPRIGLWPRALHRLRAPRPQAPRAVEVSDQHFSAFLMEDMTKTLVAASSSPLRLKTSDGSLYARDSRRLEDTFSRLPDWLESKLSCAPSKRVEEALLYLRQMEYLELYREQDGERLKATEKGAAWLAATAQQRLSQLLDQIRQGPRRRFHKRAFLPWDIELRGVNPPPDLKKAVCRCFLSLQDDRFYDCQEFARYQSVESNPLLHLRRRGETFNLSLGWKHFYRPNAEKLEQVWSNLLLEFLHTRLFPLGCARAGRHQDDRLCFALSQAGRRFLGDRPQPDGEGPGQEGHIMVQPNFEVVFMSPSPLAEAEIGRFAERVGKDQVGVLFKITPQRVQEAVGSGMAGAAIVESLEKACAAPLPSNVRTEIKGWAGQCRRVTARKRLLIECPDPDTAARVLSAGGKKVSLINPTMLVLEDASFRRTLFKRLRKKGVFLDEP